MPSRRERLVRQRKGVGTQWGLVLLVALFSILGTIYSLVVPLFEAPDEVWHFRFVQALVEQRALPVQPVEGQDIWLRESGQPPLYHVLAALLVAPLDTSDFPGFVRFNVAHPAITAGSTSRSPNVFIHTVHEAFPYQGAVLAAHMARLLSVLWGAGTIVGVYLVASEVRPGRPGAAYMAAALAALNPRFIFTSGTVNNDAAAACLSTLVLWLAIRVAQRQAGGASTGALGVLLGLSLLSKVSALALLPLVALAFGWAWWRDRGARSWLLRGGIVFGLAALVAGWWFVRNGLLYGDPLGWSAWLSGAGVQRIGLAELGRQLGRVGSSFWSPYDGLFPRPVLWALALLLALAAAGWARGAVRPAALRRLLDGERGEVGLLLAGAWLILLFASLVRYMIVTPADQGRLLFPGIAAACLLLIVGWELVVPRRWAPAAGRAAGGGLLALSIACPFLGIAPRFALPLVPADRPLPEMLPPAEEPWQDVRLLGVQVEPAAAAAGQEVSVTLYWEALAAPPADLRAVVQLWTAGGRLVAQQGGQPAGEVYPPDLWRAGDVVRDRYRMQVQGDGPAACDLSVKLLAGDVTWGKASWARAFRVLAPPLPAQEIASRVTYTLDGKVTLLGYSLPDPLPPSGGELPVVLYWRVLEEMGEDYTVFVHLCDAQGDVLGQGDGPPLAGDYPTSGWVPGETLADTHVVRLDRDATGTSLPAGTHLLVGLYRLGDGTRLPAYGASGERVPGDAIRLDLDVPAGTAGELE